MLQIRAIGGHGEVGRMCTAVRYNDDVVLLDMGLHLENYITLTEEEDVIDVSTRRLIDADAAPDIHLLKNWKNKVKGIFLSHAHLDHVGAVPFLSNKFSCPVVGSPFTISVVNALVKDQRRSLKNELITVPVNSTFKVSEDVSVEFISVSHSVPQACMLVVHTPEGDVVYANDFKLDTHTEVGEPPNWNRVKELRPKAFICESLYAPKAAKTPSEKVAKELLREVMLGTDTKNKNIIVTTFSSHMARLKSIVNYATQLNRKVVFLGRSLDKYTSAAEDVNLIEFTKNVERVKYSSKVRDFLKGIQNPTQYVFVVTGSQGEPKAVLNKLVNHKYFPFKPDDHVIFSCQVIPTDTNIADRDKLEADLKAKKVRIFKDVHVSGHAAREDLREVIQWLKPTIIFPSHGDKRMVSAFQELANELGYENDFCFSLKLGKTVSL